jgi:hypothetical protein
MAEHDPTMVEVANLMGHDPIDVYGEPQKEEVKPEGFQEEVGTVASLLGELPIGDEAPVVEEAAVEVEEVKDDVESLITRLNAVAELEDVAEDDKTSAQEMAARLEELKAAKQNATEFLSEKEPAVVVEETTEETAVV